jgi:hypothetical protein
MKRFLLKLRCLSTGGFRAGWRRCAETAAAAVLVAFMVAGCGGWSKAVAPQPPPPPPPPTPAALTFEKDIKPIAGRCAGCHPALLPTAGSMEDYQNIVTKGFVKPKEPDSSVYYTKPSGKVPHAGGSTWGKDAETVRKWIEQGAKER